MAIYIGLFIGSLIAIMRYGLYHSLDTSVTDDNFFLLLSALGTGLDIFVVLASLLCGYIAAAMVTRYLEGRPLFREATVAGFVAGLVNLVAMALIYFPWGSSRVEYDVMNLGLYGIWYFVQIVVLSMAGAAIYTIIVQKPRGLSLKGWPACAAVGIAFAILIALAYAGESLFVESYEGMAIGSSFDSLMVQFAVDAFLLAAGVLAGLAAAAIIRRYAASPASYVLCTALAGLIAGFFGVTANVLLTLVADFSSGLSGYYWLNVAAQIVYGSVLLMSLAIGGGVYYALWRGEARFLSPEPGKAIKQL